MFGTLWNRAQPVPSQPGNDSRVISNARFRTGPDRHRHGPCGRGRDYVVLANVLPTTSSQARIDAQLPTWNGGPISNTNDGANPDAQITRNPPHADLLRERSQD